MRLLLLALLLFGCSSVKPYECGPTMDQKGIHQVFDPLINLMDLQPGDAFADVGASSGNYTIMMATLLNNVDIYVEDIDTACLNSREFDKVVNYYSKQCHQPLRQKNRLHYVLGTPDKTNFPEGKMDCIYTNATFHVFDHPDSIMRDLYTRLKPDGLLFIRDSFAKGDSVEYCSDAKCAKPLATRDALLAVMTRQGFLATKEQEFSGYPLFRFEKMKALQK